jgi:calcineurin-like phosphoesterase
MFLTGMPSKFEVANGPLALEGLILSVDPATGRAKQVKRVREWLE